MRDSQDIVLGTATTPVSITVSQDDLNKAKGPLVILTADKTALKTGETAVIKAAVQGGKAPYTYRWGEGVEGKGETVRFSPKKSGPQNITVEVTDAAGKKATADMSVKVELAKLEVVIEPDKPTLKVGEKAVIQAKLKGGEPPFTYQWGSGVEGKDNVARFVADKSGPHKVSLDVSDKAGQKASASVDLKVEAPKLEVALVADKPTLKVGEKAVIQAKIKGGELPFTYRWGAGVEGKDNVARFVADKSGPHKVSLDVSDKAGQKVSASIDLKVEAAKLEVVLTPDKRTLKIGETGMLQAKVKGGMPDYTYQWSSFIAGKGETAAFTPKKAGLYKVWLEVRDKTGGKATASLDWKVEEGGDIQTPQVRGAEKIIIEPDPLKLALGATQTLQVLRVLPDGRKEPYTQGKISWTGAPSQGIVISDGGKIQADSRAKVGDRVRIGVQAGPLKAEAWLEVVSSSKTAAPPVAGPAGPSTAVASTVLTSGVSTSVTPSSASPPTLIIEPQNLSIASGKSSDLKVFTVQNGKKIADVTNQCSLLVSPGSGIRIDRNGRITLDKTARPGTVEPVLATLKHTSGVTLRADGIIRIEEDATLSSSGYNPNTDPGKLSTMKPGELDKVKKTITEFQSGQWKPLETKEQKIKEQPVGQPQPPEYQGFSTTTIPTMVPGGTSTLTTVPPGVTTTPSTIRPGGTTTPTTARPGGTTTPTTAKPTTVIPTTTTTAATPQNLTDVTVDRRDVTITVWDHGVEDGDIITIYLNGKVLKSNLKLTNKRQTFQVILTGGQNRFEVEAVNEGSTPPNTATVEISNVTKGKPNQVYERKAGQRASMNLTAP